MAIKVHGAIISPAARRVFACLYEKDIDFQFIPIDFSVGEHKQPPFLALNPFGQVPAFEDGDLKLFESRAINQYIAQAYSDKGASLICNDLKKSAIVSVWSEVESQKYEPVASKLAFEIAIKPILGMKTDESVVKELEGSLAKVLDVYEARLAESKYLGCDCYTLVDLHHLPTMSFLMGTPVKAVFEARPHVRAWAENIMARPAWQKVLAMK